jgi:hypothetical protein
MSATQKSAAVSRKAKPRQRPRQRKDSGIGTHSPYSAISCRRAPLDLRVSFNDAAVTAGRTIRAGVQCTPPAAVNLTAQLGRTAPVVALTVTPATLATGNGSVAVTVPRGTRSGTELIITARSGSTRDRDSATVA